MADEEQIDSSGDEPGLDGEPADTAPPSGAEASGTPDEEELRRRLDEELRKLRVEDVLLQSVVSLINLTSRRIAKPDEQDLEQAQLGIEAIRVLADLLPEEPAGQVREALSQLQVAYAREASGGAQEGEGGAPQTGGDEPPATAGPDRPSGLWTPPGSSA